MTEMAPAAEKDVKKDLKKVKKTKKKVKDAAGMEAEKPKEAPGKSG